MVSVHDGQVFDTCWHKFKKTRRYWRKLKIGKVALNKNEEYRYWYQFYLFYKRIYLTQTQKISR